MHRSYLPKAFEALCERPGPFERKLLHPEFSQVYRVSNTVHISWMMNFKKDGVISEISYVQKGAELWRPFFESLCVLILEQEITVDSVLKLTALECILFLIESDDKMEQYYKNPKLWPLTHLPLESLVTSLEHPVIHSQEKNVLSSDLVCRCMGVTKSEIVRAMRADNFAPTVNLASSKTLATLGCGECTYDVKKMVKDELENRFFWIDSSSDENNSFLRLKHPENWPKDLSERLENLSEPLPQSFWDSLKV